MYNTKWLCQKYSISLRGASAPTKNLSANGRLVIKSVYFGGVDFQGQLPRFAI